LLAGKLVLFASQRNALRDSSGKTQRSAVIVISGDRI
jgi:hypothetical protein